MESQAVYSIASESNTTDSGLSHGDQHVRDDEEPLNIVLKGPPPTPLPNPTESSPMQNQMAEHIPGFSLTGSAAQSSVGPMIGLMDIGECDDAYLFRVSLPGVDTNKSTFSCEVDSSGTVVIKGVTTTGEKTVNRYSQVFHMQTSNLCPPGEFSVTFKLPGRVNPQQFTGNFILDGILEGIVMKAPN